MVNGGWDLWAENEVLRERLKEMQRELERERQLRQMLQAENLWVKRQLPQSLNGLEQTTVA